MSHPEQRGMIQHFIQMAYAYAWANHRLLRVCGELDHGEFVATRTIFIPSIKATLNHLVTVDWFYVDALERALAGRPLGA